MPTTAKKKQPKKPVRKTVKQPAKKPVKRPETILDGVKHLHPIKRTKHFWGQRSRLAKVMLSLLGVFLLALAIMQATALYYRISTRNTPLQWGMSWSFKYADELGIDPYEGLEAVAKDFDIDRLRLMSYWDQHEAERDVYDWADLDFQMNVAKENNLDVTLAIGLRQPRWPECHIPEWAKDIPRDEWLPELKTYMADVIERYDQNGVVVEYQLENEFLTDFFGECPDHDRARLVEEYDFVKTKTDKPIVVSRSNNFTPSWPVGEPRADKTALSVYKRVHTGSRIGYFEYPYPPSFYTFLAGATKLTTGVDTFIHELQAEPWGEVGTAWMSDEDQKEQMDARRLKERFEYAADTKLKTIDVWGAEWYYWRKTEFNDPSLWQTVIDELPKYR